MPLSLALDAGCSVAENDSTATFRAEKPMAAMRFELGKFSTLLGASLLIASCAASELRSTYANEFSCNSDDIEVEELGTQRYRVAGCGRTAIYVCARMTCLLQAASEQGRSIDTPSSSAPRVKPAQERVNLGTAQLEKGNTSAVTLELRLDAQTLLKLRGVPDAPKPITLQLLRLGAADTSGKCELSAMINGTRVELPNLQRIDSANATADGRMLSTVTSELSPALLHELAAARQFALKNCQMRWSAPEAALDEIRHFAELYQQEQAWQRPTTDSGAAVLVAPADGWPAWSVNAPAPAAASAGPVLDGPTLFKALSPSVFKVLAVSRGSTSQGSAVAVNSSELLTNCHVLEGAQTVTLLQGKSSRPAQIARANPAADRCVLVVSEANLTPIRGVRPYGDLQIGEPLYTLGSPSGLELSLASGILSGKRQEQKHDYVQTTAPISPGSSGGGLFDARGNLVGITTLVLAGRERLNQSLNFAIPADSYWLP